MLNKLVTKKTKKTNAVRSYFFEVSQIVKFTATISRKVVARGEAGGGRGNGELLNDREFYKIKKLWKLV